MKSFLPLRPKAIKEADKIFETKTKTMRVLHERSLEEALELLETNVCVMMRKEGKEWHAIIHPDNGSPSVYQEGFSDEQKRQNESSFSDYKKSGRRRRSDKRKR